jgi:hypothetical protein
VTEELHEIDRLELGWKRTRHGGYRRGLGELGAGVVCAEASRSSGGWAVTVVLTGPDRARRLYSGEHRNLLRAKRIAVLVYRSTAAALERVAARRAASGELARKAV